MGIRGHTLALVELAEQFGDGIVHFYVLRKEEPFVPFLRLPFDPIFRSELPLLLNEELLSQPDVAPRLGLLRSRPRHLQEFVHHVRFGKRDEFVPFTSRRFLRVLQFLRKFRLFRLLIQIDLLVLHSNNRLEVISLRTGGSRLFSRRPPPALAKARLFPLFYFAA